MNDSAQAWLLALMLVLPLSALIVRRVPFTRTAKLAAIWIALFGAAALIVAGVERMRDGTAADRSTTSGTVTRIPRGADGHYWATARINGVERRMLIDSGATTTALSLATARAAGIDIEESTFPRMIDTANGSVVARTAHVARLTIGSIETRNLPVVVSEAFGDQDVLGMNFLSRLSSRQVEDESLTLKPPVT